MVQKKFEYFLNAVHYCMWLREKKVYKSMRILGDKLFSPLKYIFTENFKKRYHESRRELQPQWDNLYCDNIGGFCVSWAHHWLGLFCACYPISLSFALLGVGTRWFGSLPSFVVPILIFVPMGLCYIPVYKALYGKDRYLKYFKKFEKEDKCWHRKWSQITTLFTVVSVLFFFGGIVAMILIGS